MISKLEAEAIAERFAQMSLRSSGYSLTAVETKQVAASDWSFAFALTAEDGVLGTPQVVLVDKETGYARTLRKAISEGWRGDTDPA